MLVWRSRENTWILFKRSQVRVLLVNFLFLSILRTSGHPDKILLRFIYKNDILFFFLFHRQFFWYFKKMIQYTRWFFRNLLLLFGTKFNRLKHACSFSKFFLHILQNMLNKWGPGVEAKFAAVFPDNRFKVELQQKTTVELAAQRWPWPPSGGRETQRFGSEIITVCRPPSIFLKFEINFYKLEFFFFIFSLILVVRS